MSEMSTAEIREALLGDLKSDPNGVRALAHEIGLRLRVALRCRGWSVSELVRRLEEANANIKGSTATFYYVNGNKVPPVMFLKDAARELRVRPAWLAFGDDRPSSGLPVTVAQRLRALADEVEGSR